MLVLVKKMATEVQIKKAAKNLNGYIKVVVDIKKEILAAGSERHFQEEELLLKLGSKQEYLWGGGIDWETKGVDYNSIINLRPNQDNPSRDILSKEIREKFDFIIKKLFFQNGQTV